MSQRFDGVTFYMYDRNFPLFVLVVVVVVVIVVNSLIFFDLQNNGRFPTVDIVIAYSMLKNLETLPNNVFCQYHDIGHVYIYYSCRRRYRKLEGVAGGGG